MAIEPLPVTPALDLYQLGQRHTTESWLISDWAAGQSNIMQWSDDNVRIGDAGAVELVLDRAPDGAPRPYQGGEIQGAAVATTGTWGWTVQAPDMVPGAVFGLFTYKADWQHQPWVEFDFEFVGADTTQVQLAIHMEDGAGNHITLNEQGRSKAVIDLGFDASEGFHTYEVTVTEDTAIFRIDGRIVAEFSGADMPGGIWAIGPMKSYVDLWAVAPAQESWAGRWLDPGEPLIARVSGADIRPGEYDSGVVAPPDPDPVVEEPAVVPLPEPLPPPSDNPDGGEATAPGQRLRGAAGDDTIQGMSGNDTINGMGGADAMHGMGGDDVYIVDHAGDRVVEAAGGGHDVVHASVSHVLADHVEDLIMAGAASVAAMGNDLANRLTGNAGHNGLRGGAGADTLSGGAGHDRLSGGGGNDLVDGGAGIDWIILADDGRAARVDLALTGPQATGHGLDVIRAIENILGGQGDDLLSGDAFANVIRGGDGMDMIHGRQGHDRLEGGAGNDTLDGGAGRDWLSFAEDSRGARVDLALTGPQNTGHGLDVILGIENILGGQGGDALTGDAQANEIRGGHGTDHIDGRQGNDHLQGGAGNDWLVGAAGRDVFIFRQGSDRDIVVDFQDDLDSIRILDRGIATLAQARACATQSGAHVVLDLGDGDMVTIRNTTFAALADDLVFG